MSTSDAEHPEHASRHRIRTAIGRVDDTIADLRHAIMSGQAP